MALSGCSRWRIRQGYLLGLFYTIGLLSFTCIIVIWYGVNTDRDYIHPLLTQLIPAGHCACQTSTTFQCSSCLTCSHPDLVQQRTPAPAWKFQPARDGSNEGLDRGQCMAAFPGLFEDVLRATTFWKSQGALAIEDLDEIPLRYGMARAFIHDGELYVAAARSKGEDHRRKIVAVLSAIHRALVADTNRAMRQNIEFVFSVEDKVEDVTSSDHPIWVLARSATEEAVWLMPDFGFWAWENIQNSLGPYDQVVERIKRTDVPWSQKKQELVWRGKPSFAPKLRRALMEAARDQPWGNVKQVNWDQRTNIIRMEDHCQYMFIAHVEGRSYSASLKYRQACNSVIVQNYVEVERDFSDLEDKLEPLLADPSLAERIANNSVRTFRDRYLTKAAEACYWRMLFEGYGSVWNSSISVWSEVHRRERGLRYESFLLMDSRLMFEFDALRLTH
ncbi:uncharacterized protein BO80DRAFT_453771 [Aspergillus ibericus CBS 121593]|uniref:Glycosyl transferase CAP10 domain-containing protein n=1 Tax=Aspergillus ibericus CBS 121593 TaxID=1448316 RepID=A0A395H7E7_9EURO|nr:hypothetical protein BO80DRAFT_453771 [Aspergillus ibericus CBS 121593]RAL03085.1 hypothetical protein BO80DRAFT_453771 [Aspergillus ibericus CBS 121593]